MSCLPRLLSALLPVPDLSMRWAELLEDPTLPFCPLFARFALSSAELSKSFGGFD